MSLRNIGLAINLARCLRSRNFKESLIALSISATAAVIAGLFLGRSKEVLSLLPGLIILLPGALDMRGSIYASLGSRLSSAMHLGLIERLSLKSHIIRNNIYSSLSLSLILSTFLGILAKVFSIVFGLESISLYSFILVSVLGGFLSGTFLLFLTIVLSFKAFHREWDPDNIVAPIITTMGDFFTIPILIISALIVINIQNFVNYISMFIILLVIINLIILFFKRGSYKRILNQSLPILSLTIVIGTLSGILIESNIESLVLFPSLLVLLPAFIGQSGNIGNILASRLSTAMHIGTVKAKFRLNKKIRTEFSNSYLLTIIIFPFLSILTFLFSGLVNITALGLIETILISLLAGLLVTSIILFVGFAMAVFSFKHNIDPDNILIPIVTNLADIIGVSSLLLILKLFGVF